MKKIAITTCVHQREKLGYVEWHKDAARRIARGEHARKCPVCELWIWELSWPKYIRADESFLFLPRAQIEKRTLVDWPCHKCGGKRRWPNLGGVGDPDHEGAPHCASFSETPTHYLSSFTEQTICKECGAWDSQTIKHTELKKPVNNPKRFTMVFNSPRLPD